jgi:putative PEP-CTERM system histidine kinase
MIETITTIIAVPLLLALAAYVLLTKKSTAQAALACVAVLLAGIEIADLLTLHASSGLAVFRRITTILESFLPASLLWYSVTFARSGPLHLFSRRGLFIVAAAVLFPASVLFFSLQDFFYSPDFLSERLLFLGRVGYWYYFGAMLACVAALMNFEATFMSAVGSDRWKVKFEIIGAGSILAVLIFYFSQGVLYRTLDVNLMTVRSIILAISSGLILYARRYREDGVHITVSRYILFRSLTLLSVGVYFIVLGLLGEAMKYFEVSFAQYVTIFFAFAGGIALVVLLLSEQLRRRVKVFISKHFFAQKHDYRHTWIALTNRLVSTTPAAMEQGILAAYCEMFGLGGASLYLFDRGSGRYMPAAQHALPHAVPRAETGLSASAGLISYFLDQNRVWNLADAEYAPTEEERSFAAVTKAQFVVPLICNHQVEALVVFGRQVAPEQFTFEDYDLMKTMARQSALVLSNLRLSEELIETRELAAVARLSSFVVHDLKNLTYSLSLIMDNAEEHMGNADFQRDMMGTVRHTIENMKSLTQRLKSIPGKSGTSRESHDLHELSTAVVGELKKMRSHARIVCRGTSALSLVDGDEIKKVIVNLVQNGLDAAGEEGTILVETGMNNGHAYFSVSDTGCGMTKDFMENQLFKPFRTTKAKGLGIGLYQCKQIVEAHGGMLVVKSEAGKGSVFTVYLQAADRSPDRAP